MSAGRRFWPTLVAVAICLAAAFAAVTHLTLGFRAFTAEDARRLRVAESRVALAPIEVIDSRGNRRVLWNGDPTGRVWLVTFMYTRCRSLCMAAGSEMQQLQAETQGTISNVRFASLSFDRAHDSRAELARYAERYRANPSLWLVGVPTSDDALARLLREAGVVVIDDGHGGYAHNAATLVVSPDGRLAGIFDLADHREALAFAERLSP